MKATISDLVTKYGQVVSLLREQGGDTEAVAKERSLFVQIHYLLGRVVEAARSDRAYARRLVSEVIEDLKDWDCAEKLRRTVQMYEGRGVEDTPWYQEYIARLKKLENVNDMARLAAKTIEGANKTRFF